MKPIQIMIFSAVFLLFLAANYYVFYRIWRMMPPSATGKIVLIACAAVLVGSFFLAMFLRNAGLPVWFLSGLYRIGTAWIFIFFYLLIVFLLGDLLRVTHAVPASVMCSNWLSLGVLTGAMVVIFGIGNIVYHNKKRVELAVETGKRMERPVKIVAASDLHLGYGIGRRELSHWVDLINREKPDIILFAGDLIDSSPHPLFKGGYAEELRRLEAPLGVWLAPGNHEYISGVDGSLRFIEEAGIRVLRDSVALIDGAFYVAGRDDRENRHRKSLTELTAGLDHALPVILLDHQPYHLEEAEAAGIDLQLSGHTHYGQIWPVTWITRSMYERTYGYLEKGATKYWVSSGLGIWGGKFRIGSRSEYIVIKFSGKTE